MQSEVHIYSARLCMFLPSKLKFLVLEDPFCYYETRPFSLCVEYLCSVLYVPAFLSETLNFVLHLVVFFPTVLCCDKCFAYGPPRPRTARRMRKG